MQEAVAVEVVEHKQLMVCWKKCDLPEKLMQVLLMRMSNEVSLVRRMVPA